MHPLLDHDAHGGGCCLHAAAVESPQLVQLTISQPKPRPAERPQRKAGPFTPTEKYPQGLMIGLDVGSTTVKAVVIDPVTDQILWKDYQRHETKQPEKCLEFLERIEQHFEVLGDDEVPTARRPGIPRAALRVFLTGSGAGGIARRLGGRFVQEVNAVSLAVEKLYPQVQSVVELGGQDAKIIVFKADEQTGKKKKIPSMNDKCAGGTGAVIDKINAKLKIPADKLCDMGYYNLKLHPVAGKCGVFAETDINSLQKTGVPPSELMASLFESIIQQNLSVLTRGHTLRPTVLLLGGPNTYIRGMLECWRANIPPIWRERNVQLPPGYNVGADATPAEVRKAAEDLIIVPENAQYFAALGAVEFGKIEVDDDPQTAVYAGTEELQWYVTVGRLEEKQAQGSRGLWQSREELEHFKQRYRKHSWNAPTFAPGTTVRAALGVDGGSTSTKGVLLDEQKRVIAKAYQLSKGNPIEDTIEIVAKLREQIVAQGCTLEIIGVGTTGYAKDMLRDVIGADTALVETVAHTQACLHFYPETDVIVDVGGQDIKLIVLKHGQVKDFKLNTQCSAGNGYFLQSTAQGFGFAVEEFADKAFQAESMPEFGYGCAVFMQSDIVDFQRQGWQPHEIMAGLAGVLPKNIWLYVSQIPNLAKLGSRFVLQGGTQHNLAAVKSQVDFIESRFVGASATAQVIVHEHCGESGAIGCALEAHRLWQDQGRQTTFIGFERVQRIAYRATRSEDTRCYFCKNKCLRTFIDVKSGDQPAATVSTAATPAPASESPAGPQTPAPQTAAPTAPTNAGIPLPVAPQPAEVPAAPTVDLQTHTVRSGPEDGRPARIKRGTEQSKTKSKVPLMPGEQRLIIATCEKGTVEDVNDMRQIKAGLDAVKKANPNFVEICAREPFLPTNAPRVADPLPEERGSRLGWLRALLPGAKKAVPTAPAAPALTPLQQRIAAAKARHAEAEARKAAASAAANTASAATPAPKNANAAPAGAAAAAAQPTAPNQKPQEPAAPRARVELQRRRATYRIGIPRVLNMYSCAPFFMAYFESLGVPADNIVFSDYTTEELYKEGAKRGAIDPCFPSKIGIPHVHNLLYHQHNAAPDAPPEEKLNCIFFPMIDALPSPLDGCQAHRACPTVTTTPAAVKAAFVKETDLFKEYGLVFIDPLVDMCAPLLAARVLYQAFRDELGVTEEESRRAVEAGFKALADYEARIRREAREVLDQLERGQRIGIVVLARPYHNDPGLNHGICEELQKLGYPVFTQDCLPLDADILDRLFGDEVRRGHFRSPLSIEDAWKNSYSENTSRKVWAAKYAARHPNLVALELSSFKCGHDAPIYTVVEEVVENSGTPYFCFKDIDENKPTGSIKIRIETIAYFLSRHREKLVARHRKLAEIEEQLTGFETRLREEISREMHGMLIEV